MKRKLSLTIPTLASIAATRGLIGIGAGLLFGERLRRQRRRRVGMALLGLGVASTIPLALRVFASR